MKVAKRLITGVDIWLNRPTRLLEASGTSGEKAEMNGVLDFSVFGDGIQCYGVSEVSVNYSTAENAPGIGGVVGTIAGRENLTGESPTAYSS